MTSLSRPYVSKIAIQFETDGYVTVVVDLLLYSVTNRSMVINNRSATTRVRLCIYSAPIFGEAVLRPLPCCARGQLPPSAPPLLRHCIRTSEQHVVFYNGTMSHMDVTFASKTFGSKCIWGVINNCMGSDHLPNYTKVCETPFLEPNPEPKFKMQTANGVDFKQGCKIHLAQQLANSDIVTFAHSVHHAIITAAELAIKVAKSGNRNKRAKQHPYWNDQITSAVKQRNKTRNKANRSGLPNDCDNYRRLKGQCQRLIKSAAKQHWHDYCSTLNGYTKLSTAWAMSRKMNGADSNKSIRAVLTTTKSTILTNQQRNF